MKNIFKNTIIYSIGNILPQAAAFLLLPVYAKYLSPSDYGIIESVNALNPISVVFFTLCFGSSIFRLKHDYNSVEEKKLFYGTIFTSTLFFATFFFLIFLFLNKQIESIYNSIHFFPYFFYMFLFVFINSFFDLPQKLLMLSNKSHIYVILSLSNFFLTASLILYFIIVKNEGPAGYLKATVFGSLLILPFYIYISVSNSYFKFSWKYFLNIWNFSLPLIPTLLSAWILNLSDRIFIERYFSIEEVGIYSLAFKISSTVLILVTAFDMSYRHVFFEFANDNDIENGKSNISKYNYLLMLIFICTTFVVSLFAKEVIIFLFNKKYMNAYLYIPFISFSFFFSVISGMIARFYEQSKKMKINMYIAISMAIVNLILNFILIPYWGIFGAIFATIIAFLLGCIFSYNYADRHFYFVPFKWKEISIISSVLITTLIFCNYFLKDLFIFNSFLIKSSIASLIFITIILFHKADVKYLIKKYKK